MTTETTSKTTTATITTATITTATITTAPATENTEITEVTTEGGYSWISVCKFVVSHEACAFRLAQELRCSCIYVNCITPSVAYNPTSPLTPTPLAVLLVNGNFFLSFLLLPNPPPPPFFSLHPTIPCILLSLALQTKIELKDVLLRRWGGRGGRGEEEGEIVR